MTPPTHLLILSYPDLRYMAVDIPDLDQDRPGSLRSTWFPFVISHDGLLDIIFLLSGTRYLNDQSQHDDVRPFLVNLKQRALVKLRRVIMHSTVHNSDQAIGVVIKMAAFEAMYGTPEAFDFHMKALRQLVDSRGGLAELGLEGLLQRMVCWVDYNAACLMNSRVYFLEANVLPTKLQFDPVAFIGGPR